ncbi:MAG: hypothetical protein Q8M33_18200, partial [Hydrogenophaga sp.]|nr:hypothetical protein [Hydrogenophaga sp.]
FMVPCFVPDRQKCWSNPTKRQAVSAKVNMLFFTKRGHLPYLFITKYLQILMLLHICQPENSPVPYPGNPQ